MPTKTDNLHPLSRLSRLSIGLGLKSGSSSSPQARKRETEKRVAESDEDWYIPYNGPYESPVEPPRSGKKRDSWGDLVFGEEDNDAVLADRELYNRYGGNEYTRPSDDGNERKRRRRDGSQSVVSDAANTSVSPDRGRGTTVPRRRSIRSTTNPRHPAPSYINLDVAGGIGASPVPVQRASHASSAGDSVTRPSISSLFPFGGSSKKVPPSPPRFSLDRPPEQPPAQTQSRPGLSKPITGPDKRLSRPESPLLRNSSSSEWTRNNQMPRPKPENVVPVQSTNAIRGSGTTDDEDNYQSYYSTLVSMPATGNARPHFLHVDSSDLPRTIQLRSKPLPEKHGPPKIEETPAAHPYAYVFPSAAVDPAPQNGSIVTPLRPKFNEPGPSNYQNRHPTTAHPSQVPQSAPISHFVLPGPPEREGGGPQILKSSFSTPDLRSASQSLRGRNHPTTQAAFPKGKERWLSARTWCDAMLFPRPRLKIREGGEFTSVGSGMIISPPDSPMFAQTPADNAVLPSELKKMAPGVESRVLAHSRSLADLSNDPGTSARSVAPPVPPKVTLPPRPAKGTTMPSRPKTAPSKNGGERIQPVRAPRPKSFAQDDLALPSPVPSLARVLEEGQLFEHQRKKWQMQATGSFQNQRSRSVSRSRSKSLTHRRGKENENEKPQSALEFLAARSLVGNQTVVPVVAQPSRKRSVSNENSSSGKTGLLSHSHTSSLAKSISKSSKSTSRGGHSRNDSWSKSAIKVAKSTAAFCGLNGDGMLVTPSEDRPLLSESGDATKGTRGSDRSTDRDIAAPPNDSHRTSPKVVVSPTPSGVSDTKVGIAVTTTSPPPDDASIRLPAHPYAQGGLYNYSHKAPAASEHHYNGSSEYARSHRLANDFRGTDSHPVSTRHRSPPQASLHPYAQVSQRDSYQSESGIVPHPRPDSDIPPPSKMWTLSSGVIQEILPNEIAYSPLIPNMSPLPDDPFSPSLDARNSNMIFDTVGVRETLASAVRAQKGKEKAVETSENRKISKGPTNLEVWTEVDGESMHVVDPGSPKLIHRKPVQYDAARPAYLRMTQKSSGPSTNHTLASSHLEHLEPPDFRLTPPASGGFANRSSHSSPIVTSQSSSPQLSPRPLGSLDDLDHFHDLFYKPNLIGDASIDFSISRNAGVPYDVSSHSARGSGLTSLARQLSEEFEELHAQRELLDNSEVSSRGSGENRDSEGPSPMEAGLQFVFSHDPQSTSRIQSSIEASSANILAFQPSVNLPEDVGSSRAASAMDDPEFEDDDKTELFRVGQVFPVTTPPTSSSDHRMSGHLSFVNEHTVYRSDNTASPANRTMSHPSLRPPTVDPTRTSYMTSSTGSRMSGLSDFPAPPTQNHILPAHISLLAPYFDEVLSQRESLASSFPGPASLPKPSSAEEHTDVSAPPP